MTHPSLADALDDVVALLGGALVDGDGHQLAVTIDPAEVNLPGVIVYPATLSWETIDDVGYDLACDLLMVAGGVPARAAVAQLDVLLRAVRDVLPVRDVRAVSITLPSQSPDPLPALQATVTFQITP